LSLFEIINVFTFQKSFGEAAGLLLGATEMQPTEQASSVWTATSDAAGYLAVLPLSPEELL